MAITRSQQAKQMLQEGGRIGLRGGGKDLGKDATGMGSGKSKGISPGRSQAQFGHAAHAGKTLDQAKSDQRLGIRGTPEGSNPFAGHSPEEEKGFKRQKEISKQIEEGTFEPPKKKGFFESYNEKARKRNLKYIQNLRNKKFKGIMDQYGLTEEQLNTLLEGDDEFKGGRNLSFTGLQQLLDMDPSARNLGENFNEALMQGKLGELAMSPGMKKRK